MSQAYSEYQSYFKPTMKKYGMPAKSYKDYMENVSKWLLLFEQEKGFDVLNYVKVNLEIGWHFKKSKHYFLDKGLYSFLVKSVKEISADYFKHGSYGITEDMHETNQYKNDCIFIHIPMDEYRYSIGFVPRFFVSREDMEATVTCLFAADFGGLTTVVSNLDTYWKKGDIEEEYIEPVKAIIGLSLYIDAFPDVVREADNIKHVGHYKGHRQSVRANDIVRTEATHSVSPHFRRGHFRLLQSEKFKAKRGQAIFIKGCFVKGHAFDVLADDGKSVGGDA